MILWEFSYDGNFLGLGPFLTKGYGNNPLIWISSPFSHWPTWSSWIQQWTGLSSCRRTSTSLTARASSSSSCGTSSRISFRKTTKSSSRGATDQTCYVRRIGTSSDLWGHQLWNVFPTLCFWSSGMTPLFTSGARWRLLMSWYSLIDPGKNAQTLPQDSFDRGKRLSASYLGTYHNGRFWAGRKYHNPSAFTVSYRAF